MELGAPRASHPATVREIDPEELRILQAGEDVQVPRSHLAGPTLEAWTERNQRRDVMQSQPSRIRTGAPRSEGEGRRQRYATTGNGPVRQSLYDWAVTAPPPGRDLHDLNSSEDSDEDMEGMSTAAPETDMNARRDLQRLERALQNYRSARSALRSDLDAVSARTASMRSDLGAVPTVSALRAYWNEEAAAVDRAGRTSIPSGVSNQNQHERLRRHVEHVRLHTERDHREFEFISRSTTRAECKKSDAFARVRNTIRYLSQLRHTGVEGGLELAKELELDSLYESEEANIPSDLPMHVNSLPIPQYSSWLEPGMVWHGLQSTEREPARSTATWASNLRRERQRDLLRRTFARRREVETGSGTADPERVPSGLLVSAERYLPDLLQDGSALWGSSWGSSQLSTLPLTSHPAQPSTQGLESDHWPVQVTIHSVDWNTMTLTGTMSASHMPEKLSSSHQPLPQPHTATTSMSSFFTGEIIDFRQQPLETEGEGRPYRVGGLDTDARYWARLGPFRKEIEKVRRLRGKRRGEYQHDSRLWEAFRKAAGAEGENKDTQVLPGISSPATEQTETETTSNTEDTGAMAMETDESREAEDDEVMARSLGSAKWIEEKLGREWILMRWKERCFVTPAGTAGSASSSNATPTTRIVTTMSPTATNIGSSPTANGHGSTSWGLTISGFYYIALNRLTGEIDGLYYDPGSQPYQALRMVPEGTSLRGLVDRSECPGAEGGNPISTPGPRGGRFCVCGCAEVNCKERVGLKKWFPSVELR
ncbi:hypothetical protein A1O3_07538 [Capronia epimyces CBS 606.96]|uniref:Uncharacterized protein n=1 Tax=Capronia epimyces CBS 606.96 TaxID=1182542 RepID=W9XLZ5_9EURO|nr:uncharacterized protein A1O3_07538 [Capronia epimyces CBS 606.96]EXJ81248.1 hypothetical protein A1O3_07538 [Capronia epimyces CBS 606.96]